MFLFEPQTGIISESFERYDLHKHIGHSNFYRYLLPNKERTWVKTIIANTKLESSGFVYDTATLAELQKRSLSY
jgi:hypothetical protein